MPTKQNGNDVWLFNPREAIDLGMLTLVVGREAGNQTIEAMLAVAWSIKNRVLLNSIRWGGDWESVIERKWQYSSMVGPAADPNLQKYPSLAGDSPTSLMWNRALDAATQVYTGDLAVDPSKGAHSYFDKSLDAKPPMWATDGEFDHVADVGSFHFYKLASV